MWTTFNKLQRGRKKKVLALLNYTIFFATGVLFTEFERKSQNENVAKFSQHAFSKLCEFGHALSVHVNVSAKGADLIKSSYYAPSLLACFITKRPLKLAKRIQEQAFTLLFENDTDRVQEE